MLIGCVIVMFSLLFWFMTMPRVALVPDGVLRATTTDGSARTLVEMHEYVVIECVEQKTQIYPRIEGPDGIAWLVVDGPYHLKRGPLWRMGSQFIKIPAGCD